MRRVILASFLLIACASCHRQPAAQLVFDSAAIDVGVTRTTPVAEFAFPFRVEGNGELVIASIDSSCQCASVGGDLIGRPLSAGQRYSLPVSVETKGKTGFNVGLVVRTDDDQIIGLTLWGIVESDPRAIPPVVYCQLSAGPSETNEGTFQVVRVRGQSGHELKPKLTTIPGKNVTISFLERTVNMQPVSGTKFVSAAVETLKWKWMARGPIDAQVRESLSIEWELTTDVPPTVVSFDLSPSAPVPGLVREVYCGRMNPGEQRQRTVKFLTMDCGACELIKSEPPEIARCQIVTERDELTALTINVTAPNVAGDFDAIVTLRFGHLADAVPIRVYGSVMND